MLRARLPATALCCAAVVFLLVCLVSVTKAGGSCNNVCPGSACIGQLVNANTQLQRTLYVGKQYSFVFEALGLSCPDVNNQCPDYVAQMTYKSTSFDFVGGDSLTFSGLKTQDWLVIEPTEPGAIQANWTCASCASQASVDNPLVQYSLYPLEVPCDGGAGGVIYRALTVAGDSQSLVFDQWSDPITLSLPEEQALEGTESITLSYVVTDFGAPAVTATSCVFDPPSPLVIDENTPTVRFAVRCSYDNPTLETGNYRVAVTIQSGSAEGFFYDTTVTPKPLVTQVDISFSPQRLIVMLESSGNQALVGGAPLPAVGGEGEIYVVDSNNRLHTILQGQTTVSLAFPGQTVTPSTLTFQANVFRQEFTYTVSVPANTASSALTSDVPLVFGISNEDEFSIENLDGTQQSTFDVSIASFAAVDTEPVMRVDQTIAIPLVLRQPLRANGRVDIAISNDDQDGALLFSAAAAGPFTQTLIVSFTASGPTGQVYYVSVDTARWATVSSSASEAFDIEYEVLPSTTSAEEVTSPSDVTVTVERMQFYIDLERHDSGGDELVRGQSLRIAVTLAALPPTSVTLTPVLISAGQWDGVTLTPASITFAAGQSLRQYFTLTASSALAWPNTDPEIHWFVSGADAELFEIPADTTLPDEVATSDNLWTAQIGDTSVNVRIGEWSDPVWVNLWPRPPTSVTVQLTTSGAYELSTQSLTFSPSTDASQAFRVRLTSAAIGNAVAYPTGFVFYSLAGADAHLYELTSASTDLVFINTYAISIAQTVSGSAVGDRNCWTFSHGGANDGALPGGVAISVVDWTGGVAVEWDQATPFNFTGDTYRICATATQLGEFEGRFVLSSGALAAWNSASNDYANWVISAGLQSVTISGTSGVTAYDQAQQLSVTLGDAVDTALVLTPRSDADVTFTPASVTLQPGEYAASFAVSYQPSESPVQELYVYLALSGADAGFYVTPTPYTLSVSLPSVQVLFNDRSVGNTYFAYAPETVAVQLSVPAVQGLTVTVFSSCFAAGSTDVVFAAGESTNAFTFTGDNDADVFNAQRCGFSYELSGADEWLFTAPADSAPSTTNSEQRFYIGTNEWDDISSLSSAAGTLFEGVDSPLFYASLSVAPSGVVRATFSSPSLVFTPATLVFSPSSWVAQAFYFTPTKAELGALAEIYVTFEGNDELNLQYSDEMVNVGPFYPRFSVGGVRSLINGTADGWLAITTPFSSIASTNVGIVPHCGNDVAVSTDQSQLVFEPAVLWLSASASNVSFSYRVRDTLLPNVPQANECQLTYAFLTSQGDWIDSGYYVDPTNSFGNPLVSSVLYGTVGTIYIDMPGSVGVNHPGKAYTLIVSPPSDIELVVRPESHNLRFEPPLLVIPPGVSEVSAVVSAVTTHKESFANDAARVTWSFANSAANTRYRFSCGFTQCYTFHRTTRDD